MIYSELLDLEIEEIKKYNCEVNYIEQLNIIIGSEFCNRYSFRNENITLSKTAFYFRKMIYRTEYTDGITNDEKHNFIKTISLLRNIMKCHENIMLREHIKDLMELYDDKISIDDGRTYMMLDAFDNDVFMVLLSNIDLDFINIRFKRDNQLCAYEYIKSFVLMNKIEMLIEETLATSKVFKNL